MTRSEGEHSRETGNENAVEGPRDCCLVLENCTLLEEYAPGRARWRCAVCEREFFFTRMFFDDSCIEPMDYELWRPAAPGESPAGADLSEFIMSRKPYFARNVAAAGAFQRVD